MRNKLRIIVGGFIGLYPTGGTTLDYIQYPLGLKLMGHDVFYIEDTLQYPIFQSGKHTWNDSSGTVNHLKETMEKFELQDRWAYRDIVSGKTFGLSETKIRELCDTADLFLNISCSTYLRDEYLKIPNRILIDSDPMFTQLQYALELKNSPDAKNWSTRQMLENHNYLFTFGENIHSPTCKIPTFDFNWFTTRQPVCLNLWNKNNECDSTSFSTIMNWSGRKKINYNGEYWGQKDIEFEKFKNIPALMPDINFTVVVNPPLNEDSYFNFLELQDLGWTLLDPQSVVPDADSYTRFIQNSYGEFSVAKETYVKSKSGWFSCRSSCYLAAGKPVITQETGWSQNIPTGMGLFSFSDIDSIKHAVTEIKSNYAQQSKYALEIAHEFFDSEKVLASMLNKLN